MTDRLVEELEAEARYHAERLALYRAKTYGGQPTSADRLQKLRQASDYADQRLQRARAERRGWQAERQMQLGRNDD